jgi:DNA (cytosine-5)-methyltransferase 1
MKVLSLFSGVGGFDLGLERAGMETVALCEWDKHAQSVLHHHWPNVPLYGDVSDLTADRLLADGVHPDLVAFGSPCQDLSVAGKRAGLAGERSGLFHEAIRIIRELRDATDGTLPRWIIWENVVGALNSNAGADFQAVLDQVADLGADLIEWAVLDAQNFGVPQRRRRVFLVASLDPRTAGSCPDPLLPVGEGSPRDLETLREAWKTATARAGGRAGADRQHIARALGFAGYSIDDRTGTLKTRGNHADIDYLLIDGTRVDDVRVYDEPVQTLKARMGTGGNTVPLAFVKSRRAQSADDHETWVDGQVSPTINAFDQGDIRATTVIVDDPVATVSAKWAKGSGGPAGDERYNLVAYAIPIHDQATRHEGQDNRGKGNGLGVGEDGDPMNTLTTGDRHAVAYAFDEYNSTIADTHQTLRAGTRQSTGTLQHAIVRRLTPLECERLMGWPDGWTRYAEGGREQADTHRYKQIGNGVASPVAEWVGRHIMAAEHGAP